MVVNERKKYGIKLKETWLAKESPENADLILFHFAKEKLRGATSCGFDLETDLEKPNEEIFSKISKNRRYEIRRAEREGITCNVIENSELTNEYITNFVNKLFEFEKTKNRDIGGKDRMLKQMYNFRDKEQLIITEALYLGEPIVWHSYLISDEYKESILFQSFSFYRTELDRKRLISYGNSLLLWKDICYFKSKGYLRYNWGGYNKENEEVRNISSFKEEFGGEKIQVYDGVDVKTLKGEVAWIFLWLINWVKRNKLKNERIKN